MIKRLTIPLLCAFSLCAKSAQITPYGIEQTRAHDPGIVPTNYSSTNIKLCIIDSGYDNSHPDLPGANGEDLTNSSGGWSTDDNIHGTHVAGIIAALDNQQGVVGVTAGDPNISIYVVKVKTTNDWATGISRCQAQQADIISISGGSSDPAAYQSAIDGIDITETLVIASAGNLWSSANNQNFYPASFDKVLSVAATDSEGNHAYFSIENNTVDIAAPGDAVLSTVPSGEGFSASISITGVNDSDISSEIVPARRFKWVPRTGEYSRNHYAGTAQGALIHCSGSSCPSSVSGNICLIKRVGNEIANQSEPSGYKSALTEYETIDRCAGAAGVIVYSNSARPALQNPTLVDEITYNSNTQSYSLPKYKLPVVSVDEDTGLFLSSHVGKNTTISTTTGGNYRFENGTSMAAPYVSGIAAKVWYLFPQCNAYQIKSALIDSANDVGGPNTQYGAGIVDAKATYDHIKDLILQTGGCGPDAPVVPPTNAPTLYTEYSGCQGYTPLYILSWSSNEAIDGYRVEQLRGYIGSWSLYYQGTQTGAMYQALNNSQNKIRVRAYNSGGNSPWKTVTLPTKNCSTSPPPPIW